MKPATKPAPATPRERPASPREIPASLLDALAHLAASVAGAQHSMLDRRLLRASLTRRMNTLNLDNPQHYLDLCTNTPAEQTALLDGVLNGETSFFRDGAVFTEMLAWCRDWHRRWPAEHQRPMRILSAPCSTGEEPYSIAAMLCQSGVAAENFSIDALDFSPSAITHAQTGIYQAFALRNLPPAEQTVLFEPAPKGWSIRPPLRSQVHFRTANLVDPTTLPAQAYDLICSRNLLLYLTPEARLRVANALAQALAPGGRLILGSADWGRDLEPLFRLERPMQSFAVSRHEDHSSTPAAVPAPRTRVPHPLSPFDKGWGPATTPKDRHNPKAAQTRVLHPLSSSDKGRAPTTPPTTTESEQLANIAGLYRQALEAQLRNDDRAAERLCRQALYLDNDHVPSLELLAKLHRPHVPARLHSALHARLKRHRAAAEPKGGRAS